MKSTPYVIPTLLDKDCTVLIKRCSDPAMWYADRVGERISVVRWDRDGIWAREPEGYLNVIKYEDVK